MKKIIGGIVLCLTILLVGCDSTTVPCTDEDAVSIDGVYSQVRTFEYKNHQYIIFGSLVSNGKFVHDPDCPCNKK